MKKEEVGIPLRNLKLNKMKANMMILMMVI